MVEYAHQHVLSMDDLLDIFNGQEPPVGDRPEHVCQLPVGYRVVFNLEKQNHGVVRHISVSVDSPGKLPNIEAVREIARLFGIKKELEECVVSVEEGRGNVNKSINIIEP